MDYVTFQEGETTLKVPETRIRSKRDPVFYNPVMESSRDLTVCVAKILKPATYCDALAGSGARGIRVAKEAQVSVTLNDLNPTACELSHENAKLNGVSVTVSNDDSNHFLSDKKFEFIDIDPFGPPVRYIDSAVKAMPKRGFLGVSATDTSVLCGRYPRACQRKYDATPLRTDYYNELGLRILLGYVARNAVRYDYGVTVLFSHSTYHYMRAYFRLDRGRKYVKNTQESLAFIQHCFKCLGRNYRRLHELERVCACGGELLTSGPLWCREFAEEEFCRKLYEELSCGVFNTKRETPVLVQFVSEEQGEAKPYFDLHKLCKVRGVSAPKREDFARLLADNGFSFFRTHFSDIGFRSNASSLDILRLL